MSLFIFILLIAIVAFLLITVIMVQNPKGGGLDSNFGGGGGNMFGGVQQTTDFLDKATWFLFGLLVVLILVSNTAIMSSTSQGISPTKQALENHMPSANEQEKPMPNPIIPDNQSSEKVPGKK